MKLKANLHLHTKEDLFDTDQIAYSAVEAIDEAARLGFDVLALTLHNACGYTDTLGSYAASKNILLIAGIELTIEGRHVLILNCDKRVESIKNFRELAAYKKSKADVFVIAPHPYFYGNYSLKEKLDAHHELFDAIEQSWFYNKFFNRNLKAQAAAQRYQLPFVATSDTHILRHLDRSFLIADAKEKTPAALFSAIRAHTFINISKPARFFSDMVMAIAPGFLQHPVESFFHNQQWFIERRTKRQAPKTAVTPKPLPDPK